MDLTQAEKLLYDLYLLSDMQIALYDKQLHCIAGNTIPSKDFCSAVHGNPRGLARCLGSDLEGFAEAKRTKKPFVQRCPFGLFDVVIPLLDGDEILGFLMAGGAMRKQEQKALVLHEALPFVRAKMDEQALTALIEALPCRSDAELAAFTEALQIFGEHIVRGGCFDSDRKSLAELIKHYINHNFRCKITLSELGLHFHCSTVTLTENFRKECGITIMQYLTEKRLAEAEHLLLESDLGVGEIAEKCGFGGIEYFSKVFKRHHLSSPSRWREEQTAAANKRETAYST